MDSNKAWTASAVIPNMYIDGMNHMMFYLNIDITKTPPADSLLPHNTFPYIGDSSILTKVSMDPFDRVREEV
jgi:hypothetical protein